MTTTSVQSIDFATQVAAAEQTIVSAGFTKELWVPEFGWQSKEEEDDMNPQLPQSLAAYQLFIQLFVTGSMQVWAHLAAEMQAGKTGVVTTLVRLILSNKNKLKIIPSRIFILTGMNDDAWKKQTRERMPKDVRENVHHSKGLTKVGTAFRRLMNNDNSTELSNVIVILDESHIASSLRNQPCKQIWATLHELCPLPKWRENNVRVVTISATDPAKVMAVSCEEAASVVRLQTNETYQSIKKLREQNRIRFSENFGDIHEEKCITEIKRCLRDDYNNEPLYHILRPRAKRYDQVKSILEKEFLVIPWDSSTKPSRKSSSKDDSQSATSSELKDINDLLNEQPDKTTFILIKNMFYASKTLKDKYIGILYDRIGGKDDTNLQSLLGRACGYNRSKRTIVYTSGQTVKNYDECWQAICSNPSAPLLLNVPASRINKKITGTIASSTEEGTLLSVSPYVTTPFGMADDSLVSRNSTSRKVANEDNFNSSWKEFKTFALAKEEAPGVHEPDVENGFYKTSTTNKAIVQRYDTILAMKGGKKTGNMPWSGLKVGESVRRLYVGYKNLNDPRSAVFVIRTLKRIA